MTGKEAERKISEIIGKYLDPGDYSVFVFGSRAEGKAKKFSDFDIGVQGGKPLPALTKALIEEELEESDIPLTVDLVDFSLTTEDFRKIALSKTRGLP